MSVLRFEKTLLELKFNHLQDLEKRWQQYVTDHDVYDHTYHDCEAWLADIQHRLESCSNTDGDKFTIQNKLDKLQVGVLNEPILKQIKTN